MIFNRQSNKVKTFTFGISPEEAREVRRKKELEKIPSFENMLKRAIKNSKRRESQEIYNIKTKPSKSKTKLL